MLSYISLKETIYSNLSDIKSNNVEYFNSFDMFDEEANKSQYSSIPSVQSNDGYQQLELMK